MTAPKVRSHFGLLLKGEAVYNTYNAPVPATDGVAIVERPEWDLQYSDDGVRDGRAAGTVGGLKNVAKTGRFGTLPIVMQPAGYGAAYSAANLPNIHQILRAAGYGLTTVVTGGAEKQTYLTEDAVSVVPYSLSAKAYDGGEEALFAGGFIDEYTIELVNGGIPKMTANFIARMTALPTDAAVPAITYAGSQIVTPPKAVGLAMSLGGVTPSKVKSVSITDKRNIGPRLLDNTTGDVAFNVGGTREITINAVIEAAALATLNPYQLAELATSGAFSVTVGATQYNKFKIQADNVQLAAPPTRGEENNAVTWELSLIAKPSSLTAYDMLRWIFD